MSVLCKPYTCSKHDAITKRKRMNFKGKMSHHRQCPCCITSRKLNNNRKPFTTALRPSHVSYANMLKLCSTLLGVEASLRARMSSQVTFPAQLYQPFRIPSTKPRMMARFPGICWNPLPFLTDFGNTEKFLAD